MAQSFQMNSASNAMLFGSVAFVVLMWAATGVWLYGMPDRGTFGDMFGAVNALFSGLAFVGVIYAILLQSQELALQRTELELTRDELARSAEAQEQSQRSLMRQAFSGELSAQVGAISSLLAAYDDEIERLRDIDFTSGIDYHGRLNQLVARRDALLMQLDEIYSKVVPE